MQSNKVYIRKKQGFHLPRRAVVTLGTTDAHRHSSYQSPGNGPHACTNKYSAKTHLFFFPSMVTFQMSPFRACGLFKQTPCRCIPQKHKVLLLYLFIVAPCIFKIYVVYMPTNTLFINFVRSFKFALTLILLMWRIW